MNKLDADAFELYKTFICIKSHFNGKYDYFKYQGKIKAKYSTFESLSYKAYYYSFGKKNISKDKFILLCISAIIIIGPKFFIADLLKNEVLEKYLELTDYITIYKYKFQQEFIAFTEKLKESQISLKDLFLKKNNFPLIIELFQKEEISLMFLLCLDKATNCLDIFDKEYNTNFVWVNRYTFIIKLRDFLSNAFDKDSLKKIIITNKY